jgi:hypothetical protein
VSANDAAIAALRDDLAEFIAGRSQLRPRLGTVQDVAPSGQRATVLLAGDTAPTANVSFSSASLPAIGDQVVVFANGADYFIGGVAGGDGGQVVAPPVPLPVPTPAGAVELWLWGEIDKGQRDEASSDLFGVNFLALDREGGTPFVCNGMSWVQFAPGVSSPPVPHGDEAHVGVTPIATELANLLTYSATPEGPPEREFDPRPEASADIASHLHVLFEPPSFEDEGALLQVCNGMSWVDVAYLHPHARKHGNEAHQSEVSSGARTKKTKLVDASFSGVGDAGLVDDVDFIAALEANEAIAWTLRLWYDGDSAGDLHVGFAIPAGGHYRWGYVVGLDTSATQITVGAGFVLRQNTGTEASGSFNLGTVGAGTTCFAVIEGHARAGATAGNFTVRFSKRNASTNPSRVFADSDLTYEPA